MTAIKGVLLALTLLLLVGSSFALVGEEHYRDSQVYVSFDDEEKDINISVLVFEPAVSTGGEDARDVMQDEIIPYCQAQSPDNLQTCIIREAAARTAASRDYQMNLTSLKDAEVAVEYYNSITGRWISVTNCADLRTSELGVATTATGDPFENWYAFCDLSDAVEGQRRTVFRVMYLPEDNDTIRMSSYTWDFNNPDVTAAESLTRQINDMVTGIAAGGGIGVSGTGSTLPCLGVFLILGMLLASLYFSGKSPVTLLDITAPRLPAPKGVTAGGQMLMPFGYTEMKRTTKAKMAAAAGALTATAGIFASGRRGDALLNDLNSKIGALKGTRADRAAGDVEEGKRIARALVAGGREVGIGAQDLRRLAGTLPYHYDAEQHRVVEEILRRLEAKGGRHSLMSMTLKDYMLGMRQFQTLEVLTAHPDIGQRSYLHGKASGLLVKAFGVNRYSVIGGFVPGMLDSTVRSSRIGIRGTKAAVALAPELVRATARTTMEMLGGKRAVEELAARGKGGGMGAWIAGQATKHPAQVIIGQAFPVSDKMGFLYKQLNDEAHRDAMRFVLKKFYMKMGLLLNVNEEELGRMGHEHVDILKRSNYKAGMAAAEQEMIAVLAKEGITSQQKLNELMEIAMKHGVERNAFSELRQFTAQLQHIETSAEPDHIKLIRLQEQLEAQNHIRMSVATGGMPREDKFVSHVGGDSLRGSAIWETMVLRTMIWDAEHGQIHGGGIREELLSARLNVVNRLTGLDATHAGAAEQLAYHMRDKNQLKAVADQNRRDMIELFTDEGKKAFQQFSKGKSIHSASIQEIVNFMYGGLLPRTHDIDKKTGRMTWWGADGELGMRAEYSKVDTKRHWVSQIDAQENFAIGQWAQSRTDKSYVPIHRTGIEAELNRIPGSASWSMAKRTKEMQKLLVRDELHKDMEQRFNSQFAQNTYGTTKETTRFYTGIMAGFLEKALEEKGLSANHPDLVFLKGMDHSKADDLAHLRELIQKKEYKQSYNDVISRPVTYDDIARSNRAVVMLHEGGFAYYHKNMMLSDADRIMAGDVALRDNKGQLRKFVADDVAVKFGGRDDLMAQYGKVRQSRDTNEWSSFIQAATKWANEGGYDYQKQRELAAVLWEHSNRTYDYSSFWKNSAVTVEQKRQVTPLAPSAMRFFGFEGHKFNTMIKPFRDIGLHTLDYVSKAALTAGGPVHRASYEIAATSEYYRQHSWDLSTKIMAMTKKEMDKLTEAERVAYRNVAIQHYAYHQVWDYAIDRNPWRTSTSFGTHQGWAARFHFGPQANFDVRDNLRAYLTRGEYAGFMSIYGFGMNLAGKMMQPYSNMIRGMQMSMQGYASKWDQTQDALRQWNYTSPRLREAMQSINPFAFKWFPGKAGDKIAKLNVFGGGLEQHQLAGREFSAGLREAPQDVFLQRKGVYAAARTFETNPGVTYLSYRSELKYDAPMAEYLFRNKEAAYLYDKKVYEAAMTNTQRRTVAAEALMLRRDQELRGFGAMMNPLFGWANPLAFMWHVPVPLFPQSMTPKDIISNAVNRHKYGYGGTWQDSLNRVVQGAGRGTKRLLQPHLVHRVVYCPNCSKSGMRGSRCICGNSLY